MLKRHVAACGLKTRYKNPTPRPRYLTQRLTPYKQAPVNLAPSHGLNTIYILHVSRKSSQKGDGELTLLEIAGLGLEHLRIHTTDSIPA